MVHQNSDIATSLLKINAIKISTDDPFTWASGIQSPIYCDNRVALSYPETRKQIVTSFVEAADRFDSFEVVAGVATAGIPWGAYLADALDLPFVYVRSKAKAHGRQNLIEGELRPDQNVLLVEDLISTGGSSLKAVEAVRAAGCKVVGVVAIFQYGFSIAEQAFTEAGCPYTTLSTYPELLQQAQNLELITSDQQLILSRWSKDPKNWWSNLNTEVNQ